MLILNIQLVSQLDSITSSPHFLHFHLYVIFLGPFQSEIVIRFETFVPMESFWESNLSQPPHNLQRLYVVRTFWTDLALV